MATTTTAAQPYPRVQVAIFAFVDWLKRKASAWRARRELDRCSPEEIAGIAHDLGLSPTELRQIAQEGDGAAALLIQRMEALRIDPAKVAREQPNVMQDLQRLCIFCQAQGRCARDMQRNPSDTVWKTYCPNADTLVALKTQV